MRYRLPSILFGVLALAACEDKPPERTVFDAQIESLERARGVEQQIQEAAARRARETERLETGGY